MYKGVSEGEDPPMTAVDFVGLVVAIVLCWAGVFKLVELAEQLSISWW